MDGTRLDEDLIFDAARHLMDPCQLQSYLDLACAGDAKLRARIELLLSEAQKADAFFDRNLPVSPLRLSPTLQAPSLSTIPLAEQAGATIGRYKLLEKIGEGGMGVVYLAEQQQPVRRRVALKIIKVGLDTKQVIARFEAERQALALMDHPNIARVLDGGATETGRPYFVMELVPGVPITDFCDFNQLSVEARIRLFLPVCQAIQSAHQKGIIHRDIKPSNILVTLNPDGTGNPKVIDFGVAKAISERLTEKTLFTNYATLIGTPAYMSPEQADMSILDVDTRADVYGLGALLYELLTGTPPFPEQLLRSAGYNEMQRIISHQEPERPSTRLSTLAGEQRNIVARNRGAGDLRLGTIFSSDVDWIVMKCLEKDRTRRYETANGLAMDLHRHLNNEPVLARPPSASYRLQKTFLRNRVLFFSGAIFALTLILGFGVTSWLLVMKSKAYRMARAAEVEQTRLKKMAIQALKREEEQTARAEKQEMAARRLAYVSDMNGAKQALDQNNFGRAIELLDRQRPQPGQLDLRGWEWRYLWQQTRSDALFTLGRKEAEIFSISSSAEGSLVASTVRGLGGVTVWDRRGRREILRLAENEYDVRAVISPVENLIAFVGTDAQGQSKLRIWNQATRLMVAEQSLDGECAGLSISRDGKRLVTSTVSQISLWHVPDATGLVSYPSAQAISVGSAFSTTPDLTLAAYASGKQLKVMDLHNGQERTIATSAKDFVTVAISPDGKLVASFAGFEESGIQLWQVDTGTQIGSLQGHHSWVSSFVFWPDGTKLASSSADQTVRIWDLSTKTCLDTLHGHRQEVWRMALSGDGKTILSGAKDGEICVWDATISHPRLTHVTLPGAYANWNFGPDGQYILAATGKGQVTRWTGKNYQNPEILMDARLDSGDVSSPVNISPDGQRLTLSGGSGNLQVWDIPHHALIREWTNIPGKLDCTYCLEGGRRIFGRTGDEDLCRVWDVDTGSVTQSWKPPPILSGGAFSSDGRYMVTAGLRGEVDLRDLAHSSTRRLKVDLHQPVDFAFSPDGKLLAGTSALGFARVWELATEREMVTLGGFLNGASAVVFSPVEPRLMTFAEGKESLRIWDTETWQETLSLSGEPAQFWPNLFSPDGNAIGAREAESGHLQVWLAPSWKEINSIEATQKAPGESP
jgi:eukaryotic-like serine/threonine-protein kinase